MSSCATSRLASGEGARGQSAGGSVAVALAADVPHFAGAQHAVAAKRLTAESRHIQIKHESESEWKTASAGSR